MYLKLIYIFYLCLIIDAKDNIEQCENSNYLNDDVSCSTKYKDDEDTCSESCSASLNRDKINSGIQQNELKINNVDANYNDMMLIDGGTFEMGSNDTRFRKDGENPVKNATVKSFYLDKYVVSNTQFTHFVASTTYVTDAEQFGNSFVFDRLLPPEKQGIHLDLRAVQAQWWVKLPGATWDHPEGPESSVKDRMNHPVVHVSWRDAAAYCRFHKKRLPTEEEWERACRGGLRQRLYPWGNKLNPQGIHRTNIWQGTFPTENTVDDGYFGTCPVDEFPPNKYGLYNMVGNVWEWTSTAANKKSTTERIKKGGSFMCHYSYCYRYRCAARTYNTEDSSASNLGFRCAKSIEKNT